MAELVAAFDNIRTMVKNPAFRRTLVEAGLSVDSWLGRLILDENVVAERL